AIPNGILLDDAGVVRYTKFGGFSVANDDDVAAIERLLAEGSSGDATDSKDTALTGTVDKANGKLEADETLARRRLEGLETGLQQLRRGDRAGAVAAWREALALDPESYIIRKQIWAVEHPERFYPTIDWAWQKEQLAREREAEVGEDR
ncbi:MAG TPA: hypothetical protein VGW38_19310, partial [Chloroflexota bacterium]|nr:hypothetical protein [Chloroflexota bacterium]